MQEVLKPHVDPIVSALARRLTTLISELARKKQVGVRWNVEDPLRLALHRHLVTLMQEEPEALGDYTGDGDFDEQVVAPALKDTFGSFGVKYEGFSPRAVLNMVNKLPILPGSSEVRAAYEAWREHKRRTKPNKRSSRKRSSRRPKRSSRR